MIINFKLLKTRRKLRNKFADILESLDGSEILDEVETKLIAIALETIANQYGGALLDDKVYDSIAKEIVKALGKANKILQKDLRNR